MSTRSTTHFVYGADNKPEAIVYRHPDGYPECAGRDLMRFIGECAKLQDTRFDDPAYLAAKYVVFLADMFNENWDRDMATIKRADSKLDFLGVGVMMKDPDDIEYRYVVNCGDPNDAGHPSVKCYECDDGKEVDIPSTVAPND